jgi:basic amino acid/polyamine antiporter, APA family
MVTKRAGSLGRIGMGVKPQILYGLEFSEYKRTIHTDKTADRFILFSKTMQAKDSFEGQKGLVRGIGKWDLTAIAINTIIGAGIFGLPSKVYLAIGGYSLFAFVLCAVIVGLIVLCFAEVASRFESTGGMYLYGKEAFGSFVGFEMGWLYWVVRMTTFAANCNLLLAYLTLFIPDANENPLRIPLILLIALFLIGVNFIGVRQSAVLTNIFTVGKLAPLLILVAVGMFFVEPANFTFGDLPEYGAFSTAVLLLIYAFVGFEATVIPAGESKNPKKDMPFALLVSLGIVATLFILIQIVAIGTLPGLASSERPLADAAGAFMGPLGATLIGVGAIVSILGNLNGGLLSASRIPFAMAENRELPKPLAATHEKFHTPWISLFLTGGITIILTISANFITALTIATITRLIVYAVTCASLPVFRARRDVPEAGFKAPGGMILTVLSLALIAWLLSNVDFKKEGLAMLGAIAVGGVVYLINRTTSRE